ncbi:uncharacterized GPI-anchored protein At1g61900 isoform X2 [Macadamia integrifolia]|uniref:uncharacterized GPI-anchored protein At1g61900 isoform X2 n=1 Tax=Macadamia integrifolia TaxID=60698 RepID=UPI001C530B45|nr:uncharacterized GPI-anchored protein At1g61900 isoform X2 [Macadamia integrifolia]
MTGRASLLLNLHALNLFLLFLCFCELNCIALEYEKGSLLVEKKGNAILPITSPRQAPQPYIPQLAPPPLAPFTNNTEPKLSGFCPLNFSSAKSLMNTTAIDCLSSFAPYLANVICCPQLEATLVILIGQSGKDTGMLALNMAHANHCLSDVDQILAGQGANGDLQKICSIHPVNLTVASCPVENVDEFESIVDSSSLLAACEKIDPVNECCRQICQNAISEAAKKIALKNYSLSSTDGADLLPEYSSKIDDCKSIVLRWLSSRLEPSSSKKVLRGLSSCNVNKVCPLVFPDTRHVAKDCGNEMSNRTACCGAMESYVSHLQKQSFITNLQALDCAALLGMKLQKASITKNVYSLCHITLKDFSVQVGSQETGCLLPSLPSDATFDQFSGISFLCDLNDNIAAPWPSASQSPTSSCNKTIKIPALPAATSGQRGFSGNSLSLPRTCKHFRESLLVTLAAVYWDVFKLCKCQRQQA